MELLGEQLLESVSDQHALFEAVVSQLGEMGDASKRMFDLGDEQRKLTGTVIDVASSLEKRVSELEGKVEPETKPELPLGELAFVFEKWLWQEQAKRDPGDKFTLAEFMRNDADLQDAEKQAVEAAVKKTLDETGLKKTELRNVLTSLKDLQLSSAHPSLDKITKAQLLETTTHTTALSVEEQRRVRVLVGFLFDTGVLSEKSYISSKHFLVPR